MTSTFRLTCAKMIDDQAVRYVETVYAEEIGRHRWQASSDMWGRSKIFPSARTAALGLASQALASVRQIEEEVSAS